MDKSEEGMNGIERNGITGMVGQMLSALPPTTGNPGAKIADSERQLILRLIAEGRKDMEICRLSGRSRSMIRAMRRQNEAEA
uniref:helix-turn-helix domain-containing protein n=1 Tax=Castellaniella defragrans TaxID=75697 RepID=UPI0033404FB3